MNYYYIDNVERNAESNQALYTLDCSGKNPKHNMKPTEDFLKMVLCAHVVAAAKQCLTTDRSLDDCVVVALATVSWSPKNKICINFEPSSIFCSMYIKSLD